MTSAGAIGLFGLHQPDYAARGIPTFPVRMGGRGKSPAIGNFLKIGVRRSGELLQKFADADAFGFATGRRSGITVLDVDSADERVLADALNRHGQTPIVVRSGGHRHFQAYYRWRGERHAIRPHKGQPVDILSTGGFVVAPPSQGKAGQYEIIQGKLDDLDLLPAIGGTAPSMPRTAAPPASWCAMGENSGRNAALFRRIGREAHACDDFDQLLDRAQWLNEQFAVPMEASRVVGVARSVWTMTTQGRNRFGRHGSFLSVADVDSLVSDPYLLALLNWLKAHNGPDSEFWVADGLASILGWPRRQFANARRRAIESGRISRTTPPRPGRAARFRWGRTEAPPTFVEDQIPILVGQESVGDLTGPERAGALS